MVKLSNDGSSKLLCYKKPWYQGKNPNLAVKFGFQGDQHRIESNSVVTNQFLTKIMAAKTIILK
jgi:hypothetical protein